MSRDQLRAEGATMRVSGSELQLKLDLTGLPQELRKRARQADFGRAVGNRTSDQDDQGRGGAGSQYQ